MAGSGNHISPRMRLIDECAVFIEKARRNAILVMASQEARRLHKKHPKAGMSERDISEHLVRSAIEAGLPVDTKLYDDK